jgi:transcription antitermination protein NusB
MQPRRIARELALLSIGQLSTSTQLTESQEIESAMIAAIRALSEEVRETLERASADLNRSSDRILESEIKATDINSSRVMLNDAIEMTQSAINLLGTSLELPEFIYISQSPEVREFTYSLLRACRTRRAELDEILSQALVDWQLSRLAKIDRNILRLAVAEICFLGIPDRIAINEAVELGKRYSTEEGHRFINGVLRRVTQNQKHPDAASPVEVLDDDPLDVSAELEPIDLLAIPDKRPRAVSLGVSQPIAPPPVKTAENSPISTPVSVPEIRPSVQPPMAPAAERQFTDQAPTVEVEKPQGQGLEIQQIIPAPPKRVIPSPVKKRVIPSPGGNSTNKRVIPSPSGHSDRKRSIPRPSGHPETKRVIPAPKSSKPQREGKAFPVVTTDPPPTPQYQTPEYAASDPELLEGSPWATAQGEPVVSEISASEFQLSEMKGSELESVDSEVTISAPQLEESLTSAVEFSESQIKESLPVDNSPWRGFPSSSFFSGVLESESKSPEDVTGEPENVISDSEVKFNGGTAPEPSNSSTPESF